ncbi:MAG TPA: hypothetical protein VD902_10905 [Symbiobacteriaceae bacterium]|nr:hypothetical protein [Symbiobacteriaceae bacterium]
MNWLWAAVGVGLLIVFFGTFGGWNLNRRRVPAGGGREVRRGGRDLGANINPSQAGNEVDLWPDRTGPRTRRELGARQATDVTYAGDRVERKAADAGDRAQRRATGAGDRAQRRGAAVPQATAGAANDRPASEASPGRSAAGGPLKPEDEFSENRPAIRNTAPDGQPTQWHPDQHGVPGDHMREGHHRSASGPERRSTATDPAAHAPLPGPNHMPTPEGQNFPPDVRP